MLNDLRPELQRMMDGDDRFFLSVTGDPISIEVQLTPEQVCAMLLDAPDPLILQVISEVLQERGALAQEVKGFFGNEVGHVNVAFTSKFSYLKGRPCYEVNLMKMSDGGKRADIPEGYDCTYFYTADRERVCVAAGDALAATLDNRESARYLGVVAYAEDGIGHYEWKPKSG